MAVACFKNERRVKGDSGIIRGVGILCDILYDHLSSWGVSHKENGLW